MPESLTSENNPLLKDVRRAARQGTLTDGGLMLAEGPHLLEEAIRRGAEIPAVVLNESTTVQAPPNARTLRVSDAAFARLVTTEAPQGVLALVRPRPWSMSDLTREPALVVVLDGVQDPGNAGAILRAAEAFGATGVIFRKGSVNPHNPKCIRASAGSVFRVPLVGSQELPSTPLFAADPRAKLTVSAANLESSCTLVIGSEGHGVSPELAARAIGVRIPTQGVESLNASVAAAILLYEAARQRSQ